MKYIKDNKNLLKKYLLIGIFNIIIYILTSFYLKSSDIQTIIMLFLVLISNLIIYYYKGIVKFKYYLDIIFNVIVGFILYLFIKDEYFYVISLFSINLSNNIVFMRSRFSEKFFKRSLQYMLIFLSTILSLVICYILLFIKY